MSAEINEIREYFFNDYIKSPDDFHDDDVDRVKKCDWIIRRFLDYYKIVNHKIDIQETAKQLIDAMKWRKEQNVSELKASDFPMEFFQSGGVFLCKYSSCLILSTLWEPEIHLTKSELTKSELTKSINYCKTKSKSNI